MKIAFALTALLLLTACAGSPMGVEYRAPPTVDPAVTQAEEAAAMKRMRERAQGGAGEAAL